MKKLHMVGHACTCIQRDKKEATYLVQFDKLNIFFYTVQIIIKYYTFLNYTFHIINRH